MESHNLTTPQAKKDHTVMVQGAMAGQYAENPMGLVHRKGTIEGPPLWTRGHEHGPLRDHSGTTRHGNGVIPTIPCMDH